MERSATNRRLILAGAAVLFALLAGALFADPLRSAAGSLFGG